MPCALPFCVFPAFKMELENSSLVSTPQSPWTTKPISTERMQSPPLLFLPSFRRTGAPESFLELFQVVPGGEGRQHGGLLHRGESLGHVGAGKGMVWPSGIATPFSTSSVKSVFSGAAGTVAVANSVRRGTTSAFMGENLEVQERKDW